MRPRGEAKKYHTTNHTLPMTSEDDVVSVPSVHAAPGAQHNQGGCYGEETNELAKSDLRA
ncbi:hypothetical protein JZ751_029207 [Albula glossodonta]|uniref:Uncharacterized protein n=1 Tax=Albula glossodonta TaxID=121402 RepID=A0A8T2PAA2_9TELE|nr:hypothetical protein JZ751_029207 [Albula glossodonta]